MKNSFIIPFTYEEYLTDNSNIKPNILYDFNKLIYITYEYGILYLSQSVNISVGQYINIKNY